MEEVLLSNKRYYAFEALEVVRRVMKNDNRRIQTVDFGAGSKMNNRSERSVKSIASTAVKRKKYAEILFKLADFVGANRILELGTSIGMSTAYLAKARKTARIYTLEGCAATANVAKEYLHQLAIHNVEITVGNFDDTLSTVLEKESSFDVIFLDGNHREEPTIRYFEQVLSKINEQSVVVVDDIHWSAEMEKAWETIRQHPQVTISIDIFEMGILFFNTSLTQQHFVLKV
jgi:predicted O-methyltransferase YrrM